MLDAAPVNIIDGKFFFGFHNYFQIMRRFTLQYRILKRMAQAPRRYLRHDTAFTHSS
jgi:hypothetical protein